MLITLQVKNLRLKTKPACLQIASVNLFKNKKLNCNFKITFGLFTELLFGFYRLKVYRFPKAEKQVNA